MKSAGDREPLSRFQRFRKGPIALHPETPELDAEMHSETWTGTELLLGSQSPAFSPPSYSRADIFRNVKVFLPRASTANT